MFARMNAHFSGKAAPSPGDGLPYIMGQVQSARTFSTTASPKGNFHLARLDERGAKVINRDNNYPNNERKTEDLSLNSARMLHGACSESMDPLGIFMSTPAPVVEVSQQFTIVSCLRTRVSECPSEDSYVVFEGCDDVDVSDLDFDSDCEEEDDDDCEEEDEIDGEDKLWGDDQTEQLRRQQKTEAILRRLQASIGCERKKVHFPPDERLAVVHPMIMWSFAYRASRKGPWEEYGRDRARFLRRIECCRQGLERILSADHRRKVYDERFASLDSKSHNNCGDHRLIKKKKQPKRSRRRRNGKKKKKSRNKRRR